MLNETRNIDNGTATEGMVNNSLRQYIGTGMSESEMIDAVSKDLNLDSDGANRIHIADAIYHF